jgi:peptidoglycan hydrolase-like protein with peptidoglycan-binding domain
MADPRAKSFPDMVALAAANHRQPTPFPLQLLLGIFWEESLFKNRRQFDGGRGVGFGQVERQNLFFLHTDRARQLGYAVDGVDTNTTEVNDARAIQIASCFLLHLLHHPTNNGPDKIEFALQGFAGVKNADGTPLTPAQRLAKVRGWKTCALQLAMFPLMNGTISVSPDTFVPDLEDQVMNSLKQARAFNPGAPDALGAGSELTIRQRLFPPLWFVPPMAAMLPAFLGTSASLGQDSSGPMVSVLQQLLNTKPVPDFMLAVDGLFGPVTRSAVQAFQQFRALGVDGVVGPLTKQALVKG